MLNRSSDTRFLEWQVQNTQHHLQQMIERLPFEQFKNTSRHTCSLGKSYMYSGQTSQGHSFDLYPPLKALMQKLNTELGTNYNSVLINWYPKDTACGIGAHKDNERDLVSGCVASISLGETVDFILQDSYKGQSSERIVVPLKDGDVFVMGKDAQKFYYHSIPYTKMKSHRISLTFREFK